MKATLFCFTAKAAKLCQKIQSILRNGDYVTAGYSKYEDNHLLPMNESISKLSEIAFKDSQVIVFVGAAGIAVRAIAPHLKSKDKDPAVIVIDECGENVIPILSGHLGGANRIAQNIAEALGSRAVITTATDLHDSFAVDVWATDHELYIENIENIKYISAAILNGEKIGFTCDYPVDGELPDFFTNEKAEIGICITNTVDKTPFFKTLYLRPKSFYIGIGCRKNIDESVLENFVIETLDHLHIPAFLVSSVATIDIKKKEKAIITLCEKYDFQLMVYTSQELNRVTGDFTTSAFVKDVVGADNVCERAAVLASQFGDVILKKTTMSKTAIAVTEKTWRCKF